MTDPEASRGRKAEHDLDAIAARLRDTASAWVPELFPHGRRRGDEWRLANIKGDPPRNQGSCVIALKGDRAGSWIDFDGGRGGGPLSTLAYGTRLSGAALVARAAEIAGWTPGNPARRKPPAAPRDDRDAAQLVASTLGRTLPATGTAAEAYLRGRGLGLPDGCDLRFHPDLTHAESRSRHPALIGVVRDAAGEAVAIHRTYLQADPDEPGRVGKAPLDNPRMMLGKTGGGAVRLAPIADGGVLALSEGVETGLAAVAACPALPVWATLSTSGMERVQLPPEVQRIVILADHDESGAGMRAAETAARRLRAEGRRVAIALPPQQGDDFNDLLLREGPAAVRAVLQAALDDQALSVTNAMETGRHLPVGFVEPIGSLSVLRADNGNLAHAFGDAWAVLLESNRCPWLFRSGGQPSWITPDDEGRPIVAPVTEERLRYMLAKIAAWERMNRNGDLVPAPPPVVLVKALLATPDPRLPVLAGIVAAPVFGRTGTLLTEPGYHPDARLLYHPAPDFRLPSIPERPTAEQIAAALSLLLNDLLGDFPFASEPERAHAVALLLLSR